MIDTKQLKYAAKAAGFEVARIADDGMALMLHGVQEPWNPRMDNGQAFELAMLAGFTVHNDRSFVSVPSLEITAHIENGDVMKAAREAVFMAAVEIGKAMK